MIRELEIFDSSLEGTKSVREVSSGLSKAVRGETIADYWLKKAFHPKCRTGDLLIRLSYGHESGHPSFA